jgi:restriction endonuclease S subunit
MEKIMKLTKSNNNMKVKIKDLCEAINGSAFKPTEWSENGLKIVRIQNLNGSDVFNFYNGNIEKKVLIDDEDIVFSWSGSIGTSFGAFKWNGETALLNQHIFKIVPKENVDNHWLYFQLKYNTNKIEKLAHGAGGLVHVKKGDFESFEISLQSLSEQVKISHILINEENKIKKIKKLLEKIEIRNQYYAYKLTSGHIKLNDSVSMNINKFETIINEHKKSKVMAGKSLKEGLYPFFNCSKKQTLFSNEYLIDDSVLLLSTGGTASVNYYNGKLSYSTDVWCITSKYTKYLYYFYNANINKIEQCFQGGGLKHLSKKDFKNIEITIPSNDKDIQEIVDYLDKLNDEKEKVEKLLQLEEQRFEWLSDKLLSGDYIIEN